MRNGSEAFYQPLMNAVGVGRKMFAVGSIAILTVGITFIAPRTTGAWPFTTSTSNATDQNGKGIITGYVTDPGGGVLQGAAIHVQPGGLSTISDGQGQFTISGLAPGDYTLTVLYSGFENYSTSVKITADQKLALNIALKVAASNQSIEVHADLQGEAEEIQIQRTSPNIVNVIDADVITSLPNANIADAVGRLPGVTLERDEGEGKYVQIRGTEPRLTNVTIEGINVPAPEVAVRQVKLDVIPADLVDAIVVNKTLSADQDGDAIGGTVDLKLKNAGDQPTFIVNALAGYTPIIGGRYVGQSSATVGNRFGLEKKFGVLVGFTYDYNGRGIDDIEPGIDPGYASPIYDSLDLREYRYQRRRWGFAGGADYRLNPNSDIYMHYLYSDFKDYGNKWVYTLNDDVCEPPGPCTPPIITPDSPQFTTSQRTPDQSILSVSGGGKHVFSNSWIAWDIAASNGRELQAAGNPGATFSYNGSGTCAYNPTATTNSYRPQWTQGSSNLSCTAPGTPIFDPTQYSMSEYDTSSGPTDQVSLQASASYAKNYTWHSHEGTLQFGGKFRNSHNYQNAISPVWDPNGTFLMTQFQSGFKNGDYYDKTYNIGPVTDYGLLNKFFLNNPNDFTLDVSDTHLGSDPANYDLTERVSAAYIMNTLNFGRWRLQTGVRLEATQLNILGYNVTNDSNGNWTGTTPVRTSQWYIDPLPSVQLRYDLTPNSDIRAVYGRGLSRPNPYDVVPYSTVDQSTQPYTLSFGNPNLKAEHANDFDILYEHYLKPYGVIQGGFFYKQLIDPIYYTNALDATSPLCNEPTCPASTVVNGSNAHVGGLEVAYQQQLNTLPQALSGFGIAANYTYTYSRGYGIPGRTDVPALQRQAPNSFNIGPSYDRGRLSVHFGMTYNSAMIYQYQYQPTSDPGNLGPKGPAGDIYLYPHFQLDAQAAVRIRNGLTFILQGENINNEVFGFYTGSKNYVDQREYYGPTISGGFRWYPLRKD
jgi:TonB-dependent receptor